MKINKSNTAFQVSMIAENYSDEDVKTLLYGLGLDEMHTLCKALLNHKDPRTTANDRIVRAIAIIMDVATKSSERKNVVKVSTF